MKRLVFPPIIILLLLTGCNTSINKSIHVSDGEHRNSDLNSINGSVLIGDECEIRGRCRSVNGTVRVGIASKTRGLQAVNGNINVGRESIVSGSVQSVNGTVRCDKEAEVRGSVKSVNGDIVLTGAQVEEIETINGNIELSDGAVVDGDIVILRSRGSRRDRNARRLTIRITENSRVLGDIINRERDMEVRVVLSDGGSVKGETRNVEVIRQ